MNKKGFTLIELLTVIIILAMLVTIISIAADNTIRNSKIKLSETQIENIEKAANIYYLKEGINTSNNNRSFKICVNLSYLIENDYIESEEVLDLKNQEKLEGSVEITSKSDQYTYQYKKNSCAYEYQAIDEICRAVTEDTKTTGNVPKGNYLPGDEYICEVKNNTKYHFFVVSTEGDTVNLIMDRNVYYDEDNDVGIVATASNTGTVSWYYPADDHSYGPVTAMIYLHNATKDWDNIPNMIMDYEDENIDDVTQQKGTDGYGSIKTTDNITIITIKNNTETGRIENLKARMPRYDEVHGENKCLTYDENGYGSCPLWLANYMISSEYVTGEGLENISGIYGYWTLSSYAGYSNGAWLVNFDGRVTVDHVSNDDYNGVRPVITLKL